jgi:hypothetical protein
MNCFYTVELNGDDPETDDILVMVYTGQDWAQASANGGEEVMEVFAAGTPLEEVRDWCQTEGIPIHKELGW